MKKINLLTKTTAMALLLASLFASTLQSQPAEANQSAQLLSSASSSISIPYDIRPAQESKKLPCTNEKDSTCYYTKMMIPITMDLSNLKKAYPDKSCDINIAFIDTAKGTTPSSIYPEIYTDQYCNNNGYQVSKISSATYSPKELGTYNATSFHFSVTLTLDLSEENSKLDGGICIVIETMDPVSDLSSLFPWETSCTVTVDTNTYNPTYKNLLGTSPFNCITCTYPPTPQADEAERMFKPENKN